MADSRADVPVLEQSRHIKRRVALIVVLVVAVIGIVAMLKPRREHVEGHAFAIPALERRLVVEVLNGTGQQGLARVATRLLRRQGIDVVFFGNADSATASTRVIVRRGESEPAKVVAEALGTSTITVVRDTLRRVDVSVILGKDFRPPAELHP